MSDNYTCFYNIEYLEIPLTFFKTEYFFNVEAGRQKN